MSTITISSKDAERIAKSFSDLIGPRGLTAIRRRAVNKIGAGVRKKTRTLAGPVFGTSAAALSVQGKAASPGSTTPAYRLRFAAKIPVAKLKAAHRKVRRSRGRSSLVIDTPHDDAIRFRSIRREGSRFVLLRAGPLVERALGGVYLNPGSAFERYPELKTLRKRAEKDLPEAVAKAINDHLNKRRR